jgi:hypothetical protein
MVATRPVSIPPFAALTITAPTINSQREPSGANTDRSPAKAINGGASATTTPRRSRAVADECAFSSPSVRLEFIALAVVADTSCRSVCFAAGHDSKTAAGAARKAIRPSSPTRSAIS